MRKNDLSVLLFLLLLFACRKDKNTYQTHGIVKMKDNATNSWVVEIVKPDQTKQPFLCDKMEGMVSSLLYNCGNAVIITNLPAALAVPEQKIVFTKWKDMNLVVAPPYRQAHQLEVYDASPDF